MKVKELQAQLRKLDPELELVCYSEDEKLLGAQRSLIVLDIEAVRTLEAERMRLNDGTPYLKLGKSSASTTIAILEITSDF